MASPARAQLAADAEEAAKKIVVMVQCSAQDVEQPGAGLVVGMDPDRIFIATAAHVVSRCAQGGTRVRFRGAAAPVPADVLRLEARPLDLAVVALPRKAALGEGGPAPALDRLGDPRSMRRGDPVYALGNPRGIPWGINAAPERLASAEGDVLLFASTFIGEGHSGGALLNDRGEIVGMIRGDQPPTGEAVSVARIIEAVRGWKYPVTLRVPLPRLVAGRDVTCRVRSDGRAACWGDVSWADAQAGSSSGMVTLPGDRFRQIGLGMHHQCELGFDGAASCRGSNKAGQLGTGNTADSLDAPVPVRQSALVFSSLALGGWHTCALTPQGRAYCWGDNTQGRLGNNSNERSLEPAPVAGALTFTSLAAGLRNTCGLTSGGEIHCWGGIGGTGLERYGMDPPIAFTPLRVERAERFVQVTSGADHVCGLTTAGRAVCWGGNDAGQLGSGRASERELLPVAVAGGLTFVSLAAGSGGDTCGITSSGAAYCWGPNISGTHGNGTTVGSYVPVPVSGGLTLASISVGINHACGVEIEGETYCWGEGAGSKVPRVVRDVP